MAINNYPSNKVKKNYKFYANPHKILYFLSASNEALYTVLHKNINFFII